MSGNAVAIPHQQACQVSEKKKKLQGMKLLKHLSRSLLILFSSTLVFLSSCATSDRPGTLFERLRPQKILPPENLSDLEWQKEFLRKNDRPALSYLNEPGAKNYASIDKVRLAYKRKGFLTERDVLSLMGKPYSTSQGVYGEATPSGKWYGETWRYNGYAVSFMTCTHVYNIKKSVRAKAAYSLGIAKLYNGIQVR